MSVPGRAGTSTLGDRRRGRRGLVRIPAALLLFAVVAGGGYLAMTTPSTDDLAERVSAMAGGEPLRPSDVPLLVEHAVVAVEDERFYEHHGLDTIGIARSVWVDATGRCLCQGGSTITQQLAKLVYYPDGNRIARKVPGMAVALKIELHTDKRTIMADYLSVVPTGYGLVGARQAACVWFGRGLDRLTAGQAAQLAGSLQRPSVTDPRVNPELARARRDVALGRMVEVGYLTPAQAAAARAEPVLSGRGC